MTRPDRPDELLELLARLDAEPAPAAVRDEVIREVGRSPRQAIAPMAPLDVFESCVRSLDVVLDGLVDTDHGRLVTAYDWTVGDLVGHLAAVERHTRSVLGLTPDDHDPDRLDHLGIGRGYRAQLRAGPPIDAISAWRGHAFSTIDALRSGAGPASDRVVQLHRWPFTVDSLLIVRSFEVWTHTDDIRLAIGSAPDCPTPAALRAMSTLSVQNLHVLAPLVTSRVAVPGVRVVLTGDGGGTHDIGVGERSATLVADVVDYCRLVARRAEASVVEIEGDEELAADLIAAAQAIAM